MADWYYTTNKQQMGPVSREELRQLANKGLLKPTDLVWKDGMSDWARAGSQALFAEDQGDALDISRPHTSGRQAELDDDDRPRSRSSRRNDDYDDEAVEDSRRRRRARRAEGGLPVGVKVGLIIGGAVLLLFIVGVGLYFLLRPIGAHEIAAGLGNFNGVLAPNDLRDPVRGTPSRVYNVRMIQGRTYVIDLSSVQFDSFLRLEDGAFRQLAQDDDSGGGVTGQDARIIFRCPRNDTYRVIATTFGPGQGGAYTLSIRGN